MTSAETARTPKQRAAASRLLAASRYAVVGAGVSGRAAVRLLQGLRKDVCLLDDKDASASEEIREFGASGVRCLWGPLGASDAALALEGIERVIVSPGFAIEHPLLQTAEKLGIAVYPELELGWALSGDARTVAVTGTNGKTTVTMLIRHLVQQAGLTGIETGNIGHAFSDAVRERGTEPDKTVFVAEASSFQLETLHDFNPDVAVLLNLTPDHLDRHGNMDRYRAAKARITENQGPDQILVVNQDDAACLSIASSTAATVYRYSLNRPVDAGAYLDEDQLVWVKDGIKPKRLLDLEDIPLFGMHNIENCLAASAAALALGLDRKSVVEGLKTFTAPPHRLQPVGAINGVQYINDSKATNIDAMLKALSSFHQPIHLIAGGRDKNSPFPAAASQVRAHVACAYLIGEAAEKIEEAWRDATELRTSGTLEAALEATLARAHPGEIVLLSPGCASFDQFKSYAHRGEVFTEWVAARAARDDSSTEKESSSS